MLRFTCGRVLFLVKIFIMYHFVAYRHKWNEESSTSNVCHNSLGKLHFTTLNYASYYILHRKLFECTVYTLNYKSCYILHPNVSFTVKFNRNMKHVICMCVLLKWHKLKRQKTPSFQLIKNKTSFFSLFFFFLFLFFSFYSLGYHPSPQIKSV